MLCVLLKDSLCLHWSFFWFQHGRQSKRYNLYDIGMVIENLMGGTYSSSYTSRKFKVQYTSMRKVRSEWQSNVVDKCCKPIFPHKSAHIFIVTGSRVLLLKIQGLTPWWCLWEIKMKNVWNSLLIFEIILYCSHYYPTSVSPIFHLIFLLAECWVNVAHITQNRRMFHVHQINKIQDIDGF